MVQRKASNKFPGWPTVSRNKAARGEGEAGGDLMKKLKKMSPNYMKPTTSSDARTAVQQVTTSSLAKPSNSCTLRACTNKPAKATCSSTLKNSKFPTVLELNHGGNEAQGSSAVRVCPYRYCSLNGHQHESLPPLKSVMSARRKLLNTQNFKNKGHPLYKVKGLVKAEEEVDDDFFVEIYAKVKESRDVELDRFTENNAQKELGNKDEYFSDMPFGDDLDHKSELSIEEIESMLSLLEYVECDWKIEYKEENQPCSVSEGIKPVINPTSKASGINSGRDEGPISDNKSNYSDYRDDVLSPISLPPPEKENIADEAIQLVEEDTKQLAQVYGKIDDAIQLAVLETKQNLYDEILSYPISSHGTEEEDKNGGLMKEPTVSLEIDSPSIDQSDERNKDRSRPRTSVKEHEEESDVEGSVRSHTKQNYLQINEVTETDDDNYNINDIFIQSSNGSSKPIAINTATSKTYQPLIETADGPKSRIRIIKTIPEGQDQMKEFNPRSPRFLEIEPDPKAEKVDLRHQIVDDRKNAEDWMIDYALQRVLSKMELARKRKVALLVKAFETLKPLSMCEEPPQHATSPE